MTTTQPISRAARQPQQVPDTDVIIDHLLDTAMTAEADPETVAICMIAAAILLTSDTIPADTMARYLRAVADGLTTPTPTVS